MRTCIPITHIVLLLTLSMSSCQPPIVTDTRPYTNPDADTDLPPYIPTEKLGGQTLNICGSDTMKGMMQEMGAEFAARLDDVRVKYWAEGSVSGLPELRNGTVTIKEIRGDIQKGVCSIAAISNPELWASVPPEERAALINIKIATDAVVVYVNAGNYVNRSGLTLSQVKKIFFTVEGDSRDNANWGDIVSSLDAEIPVYIRSGSSGTRRYFAAKVGHVSKENIDDPTKHGFRKGAIECADSAEIVKEVSERRYAIGFGSISQYGLIPNITLVPLRDEKENLHLPKLQNGQQDPEYPLRRELCLVVNEKDLRDKNDPAQQKLIREFIKFALSKDGQRVVTNRDFFSLSSHEAKNERAKIGNY